MCLIIQLDSVYVYLWMCPAPEEVGRVLCKAYLNSDSIRITILVCLLSCLFVCKSEGKHCQNRNRDTEIEILIVVFKYCLSSTLKITCYLSTEAAAKQGSFSVFFFHSFFFWYESLP